MKTLLDILNYYESNTRVLSWKKDKNILLITTTTDKEKYGGIDPEPCYIAFVAPQEPLPKIKRGVRIAELQQQLRKNYTRKYTGINCS